MSRIGIEESQNAKKTYPKVAVKCLNQAYTRNRIKSCFYGSLCLFDCEVLRFNPLHKAAKCFRVLETE
jgi:hypothetical protein